MRCLHERNGLQQVDMENYMNYYMLLNPPRGRRVAMATLLRGCCGVFFTAFGVFCGGSYSATYSPGICTTAFPAVSFEQTR